MRIGGLQRSLRSDSALAALAFVTVAVVLLAVMFRDAWLHGYVLGQADFLFDYLPWQSVRPAGWRVRNPLMGDPPMAFYPFLFHARSEVLRGHFPLWSSAMGGGQPFFAAMQTAVLSPFTLFDYILPFPASFTLDVAARLFVGGLGMYLFLRSLTLGRAAALFGGVAYLLNPFSIVWLEHPLSAVAAWLPWCLLAVEWCATRPDRRAFALMAIATALMIVSGHPETAFKVLLLAGAYALYRGWGVGTIVRTPALVLSAMLLGVLLTSIQLLPFLEYARESRVMALRETATGPLFTSPAVSFVTAFIPDFFGTPLRRDFVIGGNYCEQQIYAGLVTWMLAMIGLAHRRYRAHVIFFLCCGAIAVLIMYGTPVATAATWLLPPLRVAALSRFGLIAITGVIVAGAIGLDGLLADAESNRMRVVGTVAAALIAIIVLGFLVEQRPFLLSAGHWNATVRSTLQSSVFLVAAVVLLYVVPRRRRAQAAVAFTTLLAADLMWFADGFHPLMPRQLAYPSTRETRLLQSDSNVVRVAGWMDALLPNTALVYGLRDVRSYDGMGVRSYSELLDVGFRYTGAIHQLVNVAHPQLLDLLNVKYILTPSDIDLPPDRFERVLDGPTRIYRNDRVQPRAFLADRYVVFRGNDARRAIRDTVDLTRTAVLESPLGAALQPEPALDDNGTAELRRYEDDVVSVITRAQGRRLLILTDVYYPGWVATVDRIEVPILRSDFAFRAVSVPAGDHVVEFRYRPASVRYGAWMSALGALFVVLVLFHRKKRGVLRES